MKEGVIFSLLVASVAVLVIPFSNLVFAENETDWIKNNLRWLAEGKITEQENKAALEYLVKKGILHIFTNTDTDVEYRPLSLDESRAQSYVVRFSNGDFKSPLEITTFSKYVTDKNTGVSPIFALESNPSRDKLEFYNLIAKTYNPGKSPELFDVQIDFLSGNDIPIITASYSKCRITEYLPYIQDFILFYSFSKLAEEEIRDRTGFKCNGINIIVNESNNKQEHKITDPDYENRVTSYVVHFSGADIEGLYSIGTFFNFIPTDNIIRTPYDIVTKDRTNPVGGKPKFMLESLPSVDKKQLYELYAMYVNPGKEVEPFDVSVDLILGDGTILQRWNYVKCDLTDYILNVAESKLRYPATKQPKSEIRDQSQFSCSGFNLETGFDLSQTPIRTAETIQGISISSQIPNYEERAQAFIISVFGGEFTDIHTGENIYKFEGLRRDRGPLTPANHAKQYEFGFMIETLPTHEKKELYKFLSRYVNPGKTPEPFDVTIDTILGNGDILHRLHYTKCEAIDFDWYLQDATWLYQFSGKQQEEIRERYTLYCTGFKMIP